MATAASNWIEHNGGECPVAFDTFVQVRFRDGGQSVEQPGSTAGYWNGNGSDATSCWVHNPEEPQSDIIAHRVVSA